MHSQDSFHFGFGAYGLVFGQSPDGIHLGLFEYPTYVPAQFHSSARSSPVPPDLGQIWFPPGFTAKQDGIPGIAEQRSIDIAHWILVVLFVPVWTIRLLRQSRRMKRPAAGT
jgi:hypothetical protein